MNAAEAREATAEARASVRAAARSAPPLPADAVTLLRAAGFPARIEAREIRLST